MIPANGVGMLRPLTSLKPPDLTHRLDFDEAAVRGTVDGLEAVKQAVRLILSTERYEYLIYSRNTGVELKNLFGQPVSFVLPELKRRIAEALTQDDRVTGVDGFTFAKERGTVHAAFTVHTAYGAFQEEKEVTV